MQHIDLSRSFKDEYEEQATQFREAHPNELKKLKKDQRQGINAKIDYMQNS